MIDGLLSETEQPSTVRLCPLHMAEERQLGHGFAPQQDKLRVRIVLNPNKIKKKKKAIAQNQIRQLKNNTNAFW